MSKIRFSAADREIIRKHCIGKPTGVVVELRGFTLDLVPLTTEQANEVFSILDAIAPLLKMQNADGVVDVARDHWAAIVAKEGKRVNTILRSVLHGAAVANDLIDDDEGEELFDKWYKGLPLAETLRTLSPKLVEAQGLQTMLGNSSTPPSETTTAGSTSPST